MPENSIDYALLRDIAAETAILAADAITRKREELGDLGPHTRTKSSSVDPVTIVDTAAEDLIAAHLQRIRPEDGLIGEEGAGTASISGVTWIVDPIDGTVNFLYGIPNYSVSIAAAVDGRVVAAAVINVESGRLYSAARGFGATREEIREDGSGATELRVNAITETAQALVATGFSYSSERRARQAQLLLEVLPRVRDIRRMGSAALDLCHLAAGQVDIYYEHGLNCWDFAAGALIAEEAGAVVLAPGLSIPGSRGEILLAAPGELFDATHALFETAGGLTALGS
ncbi:inositol monophosphatase family protein [Corynebacterium pacaense]|uniref:inositol monophosphatase family protein n=1 Tax=Corynebacterium pacaense TaxID=1816684 RepID=UPI0009B9949C|nr:inositol monophosphatase family protein [Corynebacterium pacaense]